MSAELDDVKALIESQGRATGERLDALTGAVKHATDVLQDHGKRIEAIERGNEEREQRMTRAEASAAVLGERLGQVGERLAAVSSDVVSQREAMASNAKEMQAQTQTLKEIREGQVARDALLGQHLGLLEALKEDKIRREERERAEREAAEKREKEETKRIELEAARLERIDKRRGYWIALAGLALGVLSALSGWLVYRDQVRGQQSPPAVVAPAH